MEPDEIIEQLERNTFFDALHVAHTFECYRNRKDGSTQKVNVRILDYGPGSHARYTVVAVADDGAAATGNPGETIQVALAMVHWGDLDKPR
jgi:hypothetical protein